MHANLKPVVNVRFQLAELVVVHSYSHPVFTDDDVPCVAEDNSHPAATFAKRGLGRKEWKVQRCACNITDHFR